METKNVRKQLKTSQNIFKILYCVENGNININLKFHVYKVYYKVPNLFYRVITKTKIDFVENQIWVQFPFFKKNVFVIPGAFENYLKFFTFDPPKYQLDSLSYHKTYG